MNIYIWISRDDRIWHDVQLLSNSSTENWPNLKILVAYNDQFARKYCSVSAEAVSQMEMFWEGRPPWRIITDVGEDVSEERKKWPVAEATSPGEWPTVMALEMNGCADIKHWRDASGVWKTGVETEGRGVKRITTRHCTDRPTHYSTAVLPTSHALAYWHFHFSLARLLLTVCLLLPCTSASVFTRCLDHRVKYSI